MKQDFIVPGWLDEAFLVKVINFNHPNTDGRLKITDFKVEIGSNKGDNYASEIFRIVYSYRVDGDDFQNQRAFVKSRHGSEEIHQVFEPFGFYKREIEVYYKYIPEFYSILREAGIEVVLVPKLLYYDLEKEVVVIRDETPFGFQTASKETRFSPKAVQSMLTKLAYYHAASIVYNARNGNSLSQLTSTIFANESNSFTPMFTKLLEALVAAVSTWEGFEEYVPKLEAIKNNFTTLMRRVMEPVDGLNVLIHGDMSINNLLVKYQAEDGSPETDTMLIDLQASAWASPVIDLHYFFNTALNEEDYQLRINELNHHYHNVVSNTLLRLNCTPIPTLEQFKIDFQKKQLFGFYCGALVKPFMFIEDKSNLDTAFLLNSSSQEVQKILFNSKRTTEEVKHTIKHANFNEILGDTI